MDKYAFDPKRLLVQITTIVLRVWKQDQPTAAVQAAASNSSTSSGGSGSGSGLGRADSFTVSLAAHPDYSQATMAKCGSVLQKQMLGDPGFLTDFTNFVKQVHMHCYLSALQHACYAKYGKGSSHVLIHVPYIN